MIPSATTTSVGASEPRFVLEHMVGEGAFGQVFAALDTRRRARVAVKVLTRTDGPAIARFKRELRVLTDLQHPNVVRVYELVREGDRWLLSMELVPGRDLPTLAPSLERWAELLPQLASALSALHAAGLVHRDVKPSNLRVADDGRLALLDFGLVAAFRDVRDSGLAGTPAYVAPEQTTEAPPQPASDWYAVGVMLFEAATGRPPFEGRPLEVLAQKRERAAPRVHELAPGVPSAWATLIDQLLSRDPVERMHALEAGLGAACDRPLSIGARAAVAPLVGRRAEREAIDALLDGALTGHPGVACLVGPSGIGKTALLDWVAARAAERGALVLRGRCYEQESLANAGLDALVDELATELSHAGRRLDVTELEAAALRRTFPVLDRALPNLEAPALDGPAWRRHAAAGLRTAWARARGDRPLVAIVDDIQWGDRDAAWLLARSLVHGPTLLVTASRHPDAPMWHDLVEAVEARALVREFGLGPLGPDDVATLLEAWRGTDVRATAARLHQQTGGHPFFLLELAREQATERTEHSALDEVLRRRLVSLRELEQNLLRALALAARPLEPAVAARAFGLDAAEGEAGAAMMSAVAALRGGRWIQTRRGLLELAHDRLREPVRASLEADAARALHAALDDALSAEGIDDPERRAHHALGAGRRQRAADALIEAGQRAAEALAFGRSAELFERALALGVLGAELRVTVMEERARALADAGRSAEAAAAYEALLSHATTGTRRIEWGRACAEQYFHAGQPSHGYDALRGALAAAGLPPPRHPAATLASALAHWALLRARGLAMSPKDRIDEADAIRVETSYSAAIALSNVDSLRGMDYVLRSVGLARAAGDAAGFARGVALLANYACNGGGPTAARARWLMEGAERWARELDDEYVRGLLSGARILFAFHHGRYREALAHAERTARIYEPMTGCTRERVSADIYRVAALVMLGDMEAARGPWQQLIDDGLARRDRFALTNARSGLMNLLWLAEGDPARARREAESAIAIWGSAAFHVQHFFDLVAQARIDLYEGRPDRALERVERLRGPLRRSRLTRMQFVRVVFWDLEARARLMAGGAHAALERDVGWLVERIRAEAMAWALPLADLHESALFARTGSTRRALARALAARAGFERMEMAAHLRAADLWLRRLVGDDRPVAWPGVADTQAFARALGVLV